MVNKRILALTAEVMFRRPMKGGMFAQVDPFAEPLTDLSTAGTPKNACLTMLLAPALLAYSIWVIAQHYGRPEVETFSMMPMNTLPTQVRRCAVQVAFLMCVS